jgi:F-type H+-transporting ATPase subunit a
MPTQLFLTSLLNHFFAAPVDKFLALVHVTPRYAEAPITNSFAMELLVFAALLAYFITIRLTLSVEKPGAVQHMAEITNEFVSEQGSQIIGHGSEQFTGYLTVLFLFILVANMLGLVSPWLESPTATIYVPLGLALVTFVYYQYHGVRANGFAYVKQFLGPVPLLYPLMLPIEIISHLARLLSLTVRLYANMFAGDMLTLAFFSLIPIGVPLLFLGLHVFVAGIQAYVFLLLAMIYLSLAVSHEH